MKFIAAFLVLIPLSAVYSQHVTAIFGDERIPVDFEFGDDNVLVKVHTPDNAPDFFRATENLHVFTCSQKGYVAMKDSLDRTCFVKDFNESMAEMKGRIANAVFNNDMIGDVTEQIVNPEGIPQLSLRTVQLLLGGKIASFCHGYRVYFLGANDYTIVDPKDPFSKRRHRRAAAVRITNVC